MSFNQITEHFPTTVAPEYSSIGGSAVYVPNGIGADGGVSPNNPVPFNGEIKESRFVHDLKGFAKGYSGWSALHSVFLAVSGREGCAFENNPNAKKWGIGLGCVSLLGLPTNVLGVVVGFIAGAIARVGDAVTGNSAPENQPHAIQQTPSHEKHVTSEQPAPQDKSHLLDSFADGLPHDNLTDVQQQQLYHQIQALSKHAQAAPHEQTRPASQASSEKPQQSHDIGMTAEKHTDAGQTSMLAPGLLGIDAHELDSPYGQQQLLEQIALLNQFKSSNNGAQLDHRSPDANTLTSHAQQSRDEYIEITAGTDVQVNDDNSLLTPLFDEVNHELDSDAVQRMERARYHRLERQAKGGTSTHNELAANAAQQQRSRDVGNAALNNDRHVSQLQRGNLNQAIKPGHVTLADTNQYACGGDAACSSVMAVILRDALNHQARLHDTTYLNKTLQKGAENFKQLDVEPHWAPFIEDLFPEYRFVDHIASQVYDELRDDQKWIKNIEYVPAPGLQQKLQSDFDIYGREPRVGYLTNGTETVALVSNGDGTFDLFDSHGKVDLNGNAQAFCRRFDSRGLAEFLCTNNPILANQHLRNDLNNLAQQGGIRVNWFQTGKSPDDADWLSNQLGNLPEWFLENFSKSTKK